jgi:hypothetical protein
MTIHLEQQHALLSFSKLNLWWHWTSQQIHTSDHSVLTCINNLVTTWTSTYCMWKCQSAQAAPLCPLQTFLAPFISPSLVRHSISTKQHQTSNAAETTYQVKDIWIRGRRNKGNCKTLRAKTSCPTNLQRTITNISNTRNCRNISTQENI